MNTHRNRQDWKTLLSRAAQAAAVTGLVAAPLLSARAEARPPQQAPAYGYGNNGNGNGNGRGRGRANRDHDRDGVNNANDRDDDNDGIVDNRDTNRNDRDNDGVSDRTDNNDGYDFDGDGRDADTPRYNNGQDAANGQSITVTGTVVRDTYGQTFELRDNNTRRTYSVVVAQGSESPRLSAGDTVRVSGRLTNRGLLRANSVRIVRNNGGQNTDDYNRRIRIGGIVLRDQTGDRFLLDTGSGRQVEVRFRGDEPNRLSRGDRVVLRGHYTSARRNVFLADSLQITSNVGPQGNGNGSSRMMIAGRVVRDTGDGFDLSTGGRTYRVRPAAGVSLRDVNPGDRVQVNGMLEGNVITAQRVRLLDNNGNGNGGSGTYNGQSVRWDENVLGFERNQTDRFVIKHKGDTYRVDATDAPATNFRIGDNVRIVGTLDTNTNIVHATRITILRRNNN